MRYLCSVVRWSARCCGCGLDRDALPARGLDLAADGPDEARELACHGHHGLVLHDPARQQALELGVQPQLRSPGDVGDGLAAVDLGGWR